MKDLRNKCEVCGKEIAMVWNDDPKKQRMEPVSLYWNEARYITFCGAQHSLDMHQQKYVQLMPGIE